MAKSRIFVVVDDMRTLEVCFDTLRRLNDTEIVLASQSRCAAQTLATEDFDLLIADIQMPGLDGFALLRIARDHYPQLPVLLLTAPPCVQTTTESLKQGDIDYLTKPFSPEVLLATVRRLLKYKALQC